MNPEKVREIRENVTSPLFVWTAIGVLIIIANFVVAFATASKGGAQ